MWKYNAKLGPELDNGLTFTPCHHVETYSLEKHQQGSY